MGTIVAKKRKEPEMKADLSDYLLEDEGQFQRVKSGLCDCGKPITPLARHLQASYPDAKPKCFNCLLHEGRVELIRR